MRAWIDAHIDLPAVVLVVMLIGAWRMLTKAQKREDVDLIDILRNADGKFSFLPSAGIGAFMFSSWVLMHDALASTLTDAQWWGYLMFWSGAPVANTLANKWTGELPWSKRQ
jgi:hypothetical protein